MADHHSPGFSGLATKLAIGLALAVAFGYLFLRGADLGRLRDAIETANPYFVTGSVAVAALGFVIRAQRWRCYLAPIRAVAFRPSFEILMIGYMFSNLLPGRVGDIIIRPLLMDRSERIPKAATLATVAVERLFDTLVVVLFLASYLLFFSPASLGDIDIGLARRAGLLLLLGSFAGLGFLVVLRLRQAQALALLARLLRPLPERFRERVMQQARAFAAGLDLFQDPRNAALSFLWSVAAWITVGLSMWMVCRGMGIRVVRPVDSCLLMGVGALGVAVPAPGGMGSFHYFILQGLLGLGLQDVEVGQAAAIVMWGVGFVPVMVFGLLAMLGRGLRLKELERSAASGDSR